MTTSKQWLHHHFVELNLTAKRCAVLAGCSEEAMLSRLSRAGVVKADHPLRRRVIARYPGSGKVYRDFPSINAASRATGIGKGSISSCLHGVYEQMGGYTWHYQRTYGEELLYRQEHLDAGLPLDEMLDGLYRGLPKRMSREQALRYYTTKLRRVFAGAA